MKLILLILTITFFCFNSYAQNNDISNIINIEYNIKLIKFYIDKNEYDNALEYIDKTLEEAIEKDSLFYLKASIYKEKEDWLQSSEFYAEAVLYTTDELVIEKRLADFEDAIVHVSSLTAFDIVSIAVSKAQNPQKHIGFLNILARLYENNQLYGEANDVYSTLLLETEESENLNLVIKIVTNKIFQKEYEEALNILEPLITIEDSLYNEKLLFLDYIANISIKDYKEAKVSLIRLYLDFPQHVNRKEILAGLAEIYELQDQFLMSWYMLNELFKIGDEIQRFKLRIDVERIKQKICESDTIEDQFRFFVPRFESEEQSLSPHIIE